MLKYLGSVLFLVFLSTAFGTSPTRSPDEVAMRIDRALAERKIDLRLAALTEVGKSLTLPEITVAEKRAEGLTQLRERVTLREATFIRWGELAPAAAFDAVMNWSEGVSKVQVLHAIVASYAHRNVHAAASAVVHLPPGRARNDAVEIVAEIWAGSDATAALNWVGTLPPDGFPIDRAVRKVYFVWVHENPASASSAIAQYPSGDYKNALVMNVASDWASSDPAAATVWANTLANASERELALASVIESWADADPRAAADYALKLSPVGLQQRALSSALTRWAGQDPENALNWIEKHCDGGLESTTVSAVLNVWAPVSPDSAGRWVENLPGGPLRESAIASYIDAVKSWNPAAGAKLALQSADPSARILRVEQCLRLWLLWDPAGAGSWLEQTDFSTELKRRWISQLPREDS